MVVSGRTLDRERMAIYTRALLGSGLYPQYGGYYINTPKPVEVFEGVLAPEHAALIVRFPCLRNARAFWNSQRYQNEIRPLRLNPSAGDYTVAVYDELALPPYMADKVVRPDFRSPFVANNGSAPALSAAAPVFRRTSIVVGNIARSLTLFDTTLGFTSGTPRLLSNDASAVSVFGVHGRGPLRFVTLDAGADQPAVVGLLEARVPAQPTLPVAAASTALVILTRDRLAALDRLIADQRLQVVSRAALASPLYGNGVELAFRDWDGNLLVVVDFNSTGP